MMNNYQLIHFVLLTFLFVFGLHAQENCETKLAQLLEQEDYEKILLLTDECLAANPHDVSLYEAKSMALNKLDRGYDALALLNQGVQEHPDNPNFLMLRANEYYFNGYFDLAIMDNTTALNYTDSDSLKLKILSNLASAKHSKRDFEGAIQDYQAALKIKPDELGALNNIAASYHAIGKKEEALESYEKALKIDSLYSPALTSIGFMYAEDGYHKKALTYIDKAVQVEPEEPLNYNNRGYIKYKLGDLEAAEKDVNYSLSLYPQNAYAYRNKALIFIEKEQTTEACEMLEQAVQYGFTVMYGDEVQTLMEKHCQK